MSVLDNIKRFEAEGMSYEDAYDKAIEFEHSKNKVLTECEHDYLQGYL
jgi:hypothetical protein